MLPVELEVGFSIVFLTPEGEIRSGTVKNFNRSEFLSLSYISVLVDSPPPEVFVIQGTMLERSSDMILECYDPTKRAGLRASGAGGFA